jgi:hypothetical protein
MADNYVNTNAPLRSGELAQPIKLETNNLAKMIQQGPAYVEQLAASSPFKMENLFGVKTGVEAAMALESTRTRSEHKQPVRTMFARGTLAYDVAEGKRVTIIKANVGVTKRGYNIHRVASSGGNTWLQSEKKLKRL